ncbi:MAG TPA: phytanoyl-CoA dioxygenase family protein [Thermoanaerobaculia bacterium]
MNGSFALTPQQIENFRENGCGVLHDVLTAEQLAHYVPAMREYILGIIHHGTGIDAAPFRNNVEGEIRTSYNLAEAPQLVREFVESPRLGEIAARLLGVDAVRVLHFSGHFKPAGGPPTPWHQDLSYIPLDTDDVVSLWVALSDVEPDMGPLVFAKGSHQSRQIDGGDLRKFRLVQNEPMRAGDVSMHTGWTLHGALPNRGARQREAVTICYYRDGARVDVGRDVPAMRGFLDGCFAGLQPGDLAAGPLNPVVWRANA